MKKGWQEQSRANQCPGLVQLQALLKQKALWIAQKAKEEKNYVAQFPDSLGLRTFFVMLG